MSNLRIISSNVYDAADTLTATSEASGFLIANTQINSKIKTWRSVNLSAQTITATWTTARAISGIAAVFTNLIAGSTIQAKLYTLSGDSSPVYDSGVKNITFAYPPPEGFTTINSLSFAYGGGNHYSFFFPELTVEKMEVILNSAGNPDGYIEVSRLVAGSAWSPSRNAEVGAEVRFVDLTKSAMLESGEHVAERNPIYRELSFNMKYMEQADKQQLNTIMRSNGKAVPVFISLQPEHSSQENELSTQMFGRFKEPVGTAIASLNLYSSSVEVQEI